jgi:lactoylglutathione lyase
MSIRLRYVILFVADMRKSVRFYHETLQMPLKFQSSEWSELSTGETTLALHPASPQNPAGKIQVGFEVQDIEGFYHQMTDQGVQFTQPPTSEAGSRLARFIDADRVEFSVSGKYFFYLFSTDFNRSWYSLRNFATLGAITTRQ